MNRMQKICGPAALRCVFFGLLLVLPACSRPSSSPFMSPAAGQEPEPELIITIVHIDPILPELSDVIHQSGVAVIATIEPTTITYNYFEKFTTDESGYPIEYRKMRIYKINVERYLKGSGEMVIHMAWPEGETIVAKNQEELQDKLAVERLPVPPLELDKRYLLFFGSHEFKNRPNEWDLSQLYEGSPRLRTFEITESGEAIPVLEYYLQYSDIPYLIWTIEEYIDYIESIQKMESPVFIPTLTPAPIYQYRK
jgi:hypothetical protein